MKTNSNLIFTANTHPHPNFITDDGKTLKMIKGNATLKVYLVILRHTIGFNQSSIHLSNSTISEKTGLAISEVRRIEKELKNKYKLIHYDSLTGGRGIKNIQVLLPEQFYKSKDEDTEKLIKDLESKGYKITPPENKIKPTPKSENKTLIKIWNEFVVYAKKNLTSSSNSDLAKSKVFFSEKTIEVIGNLTNTCKAVLEKYMSEKNVSLIIKEDDK